MLFRSLNRPVIITNAIHRVLVFQNPLNMSIKIEEFFSVPPAKVNEEHLFEGDINLLFNGELIVDDYTYPYMYLPLQAAGHSLGYCIVLNICSDSESFLLKHLEKKDKDYILQASLALLLVLRNKREYDMGQEQFKDEFIRDVLYNNYDSKSSIYEKSNLWKWNLQGPMVVIVLELDKEKIQIARELIPRLFNQESPIVAYINNQITIILNMKNSRKEKQKNALQNFFTSYISQLKLHKVGQAEIGVGSTVSAVTDLYKSYQEAKVALELGKVFNHNPICFFEEMGFLKFIFTQPALELQEFTQRILGSLINSDLETGGDLLDTLKAYIDCKCQIGECSKSLYIHENTLRNRIKKIEELTAFDLRRVDHMVNLYIALQVLHLGKES